MSKGSSKKKNSLVGKKVRYVQGRGFTTGVVENVENDTVTIRRNSGHTTTRPANKIELAD